MARDDRRAIECYPGRLHPPALLPHTQVWQYTISQAAQRDHSWTFDNVLGCCSIALVSPSDPAYATLSGMSTDQLLYEPVCRQRRT
jgi:hypothetical protein